MKETVLVTPLSTSSTSMQNSQTRRQLNTQSPQALPVHRGLVIESYALPDNIWDFFQRADESLGELTAIAKDESELLAADVLMSLDNLDKALQLIKGDFGDGGLSGHGGGGSRGGGGGKGDKTVLGGDDDNMGGEKDWRSRDKDDPWWRKLYETLKVFGKRIASIAFSIADKMSSHIEMAAKEITSRAWGAFWQGVGIMLGSILSNLLGGPFFL